MKTAWLLILAIMLMFTHSVYAGEIHDAASEGDLVKIQTLVSGNPNLADSADDKGSTPLHLASSKGHLEVVKFLVEKGADIEAVNGRGFTPLQLAAYGRHREVVEFLLEKGANIDAKNKSNEMTALDFSLLKEIQVHKLDIAPFLISKGAQFDVNKKNQMGLTPLDLAIVFGYTEAVEYLMSLGADINYTGRGGMTPLASAISRGRPEIAKLLLERGADVNAPDQEGNPPVYMAVEKGQADIVGMLLDKGVNMNFVEKRHGRTLLHIASIKGYKDVVDTLLAKGADVKTKDAYGKTPLFYAGKYGHKMTADFLTKHGADKSGNMEENYGKSPFLTRRFNAGEAEAWYLANRGWAVKTQNHMLIFDSEEFGTRRPTEPSLANGFLTPSEIGDQNILAIYTCYHGELGEPAYIHTIEDSVKNITYIHNQGDNWRGSDKCVYLEPREEKNFDSVQIVPISIQESMPVLGYLCKLDGLVLFYSGFQPEDYEKYKKEIDFLTQYTSEADLAFLPIAESGQEDSASMYLLEKLQPKAVFPLDPDRREYLFPDMTKMIEKNGIKTEVFCAENPGDKFFFNSSSRK
jgi:ankyrin repeat protein